MNIKLESKIYKNKEWLENAYRGENLSSYQIAELCKVTYSTIRRWLQKFDIPIRSWSEAGIIRCNSENAKYHNKEWLQKKYLRKKLSLFQIAKLCGVTLSTIEKWMIKFDIYRRSESESTHLVRANHCNLSQETIEWISGELLGDGCLHSINPYSVNFTYSSKHLDYIKYVANTLKSFEIKQAGKIYKEYHKKMNCYSYHYCSLYYEELLHIHKKWYSSRDKKIIPKDLKLSPLTCRQWYIGDGSLIHQNNVRPYIQLATCGFILSDVKWLIYQLIKLGFKATRRPAGNTIGISTRSTRDFLNYIGKCPVDCYRYKFNYYKMLEVG